jgi:ferric-dicitrate binding protein FerR (iron transport regulator)
VFLEGEAYFDVAHDPSSVFTVHTGSITTRALGTQFDVRAFAEERKIRVAVLEGTVAFDDTAIMNAGSVARRTADGVLTRLPNTDPTALTAWTQGTLSFTNVPLSEVLPQLKRWYGLTVYLANTQLGKRTLTATFHGTDTPSTVLDAIAHQLDVHVEHRGLDILIR